MGIEPHKDADSRNQRGAVGNGEFKCNIADRPTHGENARNDWPDSTVSQKYTKRTFLSDQSYRSKALRPMHWQSGCFDVSGSDLNTTDGSSTQFLEKIKGDLAVEATELLLRDKYDETENRLGHTKILQLLKFCLKTYFMFDGTIYEQVKGTPMGSPISGLIAEAVLQRSSRTHNLQ
ncbi:hypothetical protein SprV_0200726100 [Sparganum proliferum]